MKTLRVICFVMGGILSNFSVSIFAETIKCPAIVPVQGTSNGEVSGWQTMNGGAANASFVKADLTVSEMRCIYTRAGGDMVLERSIASAGGCVANGMTFTCKVACPSAGIEGAVTGAPAGWHGLEGGSVAATFKTVRQGGPGVQCVYTAHSLTVSLERPFPAGEKCKVVGKGFDCVK